jgi:hypothetical protein
MPKTKNLEKSTYADLIDILKNKDSELYQLYKRPVKEKKKYMGHFVGSAGLQHQLDMLELPNDKGFKYCLVVVDVGSRVVDAEPMKGKSANDVLQACEKIYDRGILTPPRMMSVDAGSEFKGAFKKFYEKQGVVFKVAIPNRHRQQGVVESANNKIGTLLHKLMTAMEMITLEHSTEWKPFLRPIIEYLNDQTDIKNIAENKKDYDVDNDETVHKFRQYIPQNGFSEILDIGQKVRVKYQKDDPRSYHGDDKLFGNLRSGDIKFNPDVMEITDVSVYPDQPVFYELDHKKGVLYTAQQLQVVKDSETEPEASKLLPHTSYKNVKKNQRRISKLMDMKKEKGKTYYLVKWYGYPKEEDWSWTPSNEISKEEINKFNQT